MQLSGVNKNHKKTNKLRIKLPTYYDLINKWEKIDFSKILKSSENEENFIKNINKAFDETMLTSFKNHYVNKFFIWKHVEEYIAEQEILDNIFQNWFAWTNYNLANDFRQNDLNIKKDKQNQYKLISMISNTLEDQKCQINIIRLRNAINELNYFIEKAKD